MNLYETMQDIQENLHKKGVFRCIKAKDQKGAFIYLDKKPYVNLSSNDYLGLAEDELLNEEFLDTLPFDAKRMSSSGSPLLTGAFNSYKRCEDLCFKLFNKHALFFNTGFAANSGVIKTLASLKNTLVIADKFAHASIIEGLSAASGKIVRYSHNDYEHLERLINKVYDDYDNIIVATEGVFSMDGDMANLQLLSSLKDKYKKLYLYVDEAHSFSVYGDDGLGLCAKAGLLDKIDFILCTCGKGLGSQGAFLLCNEVSKSYFINTVRPLIFSTAMSPLCFEHIAFMLKKLASFNDRRLRLQKISSYIHNALKEGGFDDLSESQIIPLLTYDNDSALKAYEFFLSRNFYAMPVRHPTVPLGKARLRLSLSASLKDAMVDDLVKAILDFKK